MHIIEQVNQYSWQVYRSTCCRDYKLYINNLEKEVWENKLKIEETSAQHEENKLYVTKLDWTIQQQTKDKQHAVLLEASLEGIRKQLQSLGKQYNKAFSETQKWKSSSNLRT